MVARDVDGVVGLPRHRRSATRLGGDRERGVPARAAERLDRPPPPAGSGRSRLDEGPGAAVRRSGKPARADPGDGDAPERVDDDTRRQDRVRGVGERARLVPAPVGATDRDPPGEENQRAIAAGRDIRHADVAWQRPRSGHRQRDGRRRRRGRSRRSLSSPLSQPPAPLTPTPRTLRDRAPRCSDGTRPVKLRSDITLHCRTAGVNPSATSHNASSQKRSGVRAQSPGEAEHLLDGLGCWLRASSGMVAGHEIFPPVSVWPSWSVTMTPVALSCRSIWKVTCLSILVAKKLVSTRRSAGRSARRKCGRAARFSSA